MSYTLPTECSLQNYFIQFKDYDITSFVPTRAAEKISFAFPRKNIFAFDPTENKPAVSDYKMNLSGNAGMAKWTVLEIQLVQDFLRDCFSIHPSN